MSIRENALAEIERQRLKHEPYSPVNMVGMQLVEILKALPERASEVVLADWSHGEFCVIAAKCTAELVEEGAALHHCVGGYTSEVLEGRVIFFIRRAENPKQPYMTLNLNIKTDNVIQLHGYGNNETPAEREHVMAWVNQWLAEVWLPGKKRRNLKTRAA